MRHDTQVKILRRFFEAREGRTTDMAAEPYRNPASVYTDPDRFAAEEQRLFRSGAVVVALSGDLPQVGEYVTTDVAGVPLLLVRGEDGAVRAFLNVCRHRGGRVADGRGCPGRSFSCPYHSWTYDIHGQLLGQPLAQQGFEGLDRDELGLIPLPVTERFGVILVRPGGGEPIDAEAELGGLGPELADHGFAAHRFFTEHSSEWEMNWKLGVDTFLEAYHIFSLHKATIAPDFMSTPCIYDPFGPHARILPFRRTVLELAEQSEDDWRLRPHASILYRLAPHVVLNLTAAGHAEMWEFNPLGSPHRTRVTIRFYTPGEVGSEKERDFWNRNVDYTVGVVVAEDFPQQQTIHANLRTGLLPELVYGRNEPALIQFHKELTVAVS